LREPNLGKTNPCVTLHYLLAICFAPSLADSFIFLTLTWLVVVFIFVNFSFALFTPPPLGDYQPRHQGRWSSVRAAGHMTEARGSLMLPTMKEKGCPAREKGWVESATGEDGGGRWEEERGEKKN
jgi:hypothetical protein